MSQQQERCHGHLSSTESRRLCTWRVVSGQSRRIRNSKAQTKAASDVAICGGRDSGMVWCARNGQRDSRPSVPVHLDAKRSLFCCHQHGGPPPPRLFLLVDRPPVSFFFQEGLFQAPPYPVRMTVMGGGNFGLALSLVLARNDVRPASVSFCSFLSRPCVVAVAVAAAVAVDHCVVVSSWFSAVCQALLDHFPCTPAAISCGCPP